MEFCKAFNAKTQSMENGMPIPVIITVYADRSFSFITKTPPAAVLLKRAAAATLDEPVLGAGRADRVVGQPRRRAGLLQRRGDRAVRKLNELECVGDQVYANVWGSDDIVRIDSSTGRVNAVIDASGLLTASEAARADVLNGIAYDREHDTFFLTGKNWPTIYEVRFVAVEQVEHLFFGQTLGQAFNHEDSVLAAHQNNVDVAE